MAFNVFCKLEGVQCDGEAQEVNHKKWISVLEYGHQITQKGGADPGQVMGHPGGRADVASFHIMKWVDTASPYLAQLCCSGTQFKTLTIDVCVANHDESVLMKYTLSNCIVYAFAPEGDTKDEELIRPKEWVEFRCSHIAWEYTPFASDGKPGTGAKQKTQWNIATHANAGPS